YDCCNSLQGCRSLYRHHRNPSITSVEYLTLRIGRPDSPSRVFSPELASTVIAHTLGGRTQVREFAVGERPEALLPVGVGLGVVGPATNVGETSQTMRSW